MVVERRGSDQMQLDIPVPIFYWLWKALERVDWNLSMC